jgi:hypothetical protein
MARLEGTGKDPLGRYGAGEIFDVPKFRTNADAANGTVNPDYQYIVDQGWAKEVAPEDDPGRTPSQIAAAKVGVSGYGTLSDPVDARLADDMTYEEAYSLVHTGDPSARLGDDLRTDGINEGQSSDANAVPALNAVLPEDKQHPEALRMAGISDVRREGKVSGPEQRGAGQRRGGNAEAGEAGSTGTPVTRERSTAKESEGREPARAKKSTDS